MYHNNNYNSNYKPRVNNILLYTILNQKYVITIEAIYKISNRFGKVLRIVMIRKKGTQAMVEFATTDDASKAKEELHDQDIYSGCCTLKVDYSKTSRLNVRKNDANSWDFELQPNLTSEATKTPLISNGPAPYENLNNNGYTNHPTYNNNNQQGYQRYNNYNNNNYNGNNSYNGGNPSHSSDQGYNNQNSNSYNNSNNNGPNGNGRTPVAILYGLTENTNCDQVFNLLCLYGNINKVKFMKSKQGCAIVEFTDTEAVTKATKLTGAELFGNKLTLRPSKSMFVGEPKGETFDLPGGLPAYKDFTNSKFNRFATAEKASKNRDQIPRATVHFFNAPVDCDEEQLKQLVSHANDSLGLHPSRNVSRDEDQPIDEPSQKNNGPTDSCHLEIENVIIFPKKRKKQEYSRFDYF